MDEITLTIPRDEDFHNVAHLVVAGLGARLDLTVDAIEDLRLALDELLRGRSGGDQVTVVLRRSDQALEAQVGPFPAGLLETELAHREGVGLQRVLATVADEFELVDEDGGQWVRLRKSVGDGAPGAR